MRLYDQSQEIPVCASTQQHPGEKPYKCPSCPYATNNPPVLKSHLLTHSSKRCVYNQIAIHANAYCR